jgi:hypothetical protein
MLAAHTLANIGTRIGTSPISCSDALFGAERCRRLSHCESLSPPLRGCTKHGTLPEPFGAPHCALDLGVAAASGGALNLAGVSQLALQLTTDALSKNPW